MPIYVKKGTPSSPSWSTNVKNVYVKTANNTWNSVKKVWAKIVNGWIQIWPGDAPSPDEYDPPNIRTGGYNGTIATSPQYINTVLYGHDGKVNGAQPITITNRRMYISEDNSGQTTRYQLETTDIYDLTSNSEANIGYKRYMADAWWLFYQYIASNVWGSTTLYSQPVKITKKIPIINTISLQEDYSISQYYSTFTLNFNIDDTWYRSIDISGSYVKWWLNSSKAPGGTLLQSTPIVNVVGLSSSRSGTFSEYNGTGTTLDGSDVYVYNGAIPTGYYVIGELSLNNSYTVNSGSSVSSYKSSGASPAIASVSILDDNGNTITDNSYLPDQLGGYTFSEKRAITDTFMNITAIVNYATANSAYFLDMRLYREDTGVYYNKNTLATLTQSPYWPTTSLSPNSVSLNGEVATVTWRTDTNADAMYRIASPNYPSPNGQKARWSVEFRLAVAPTSTGVKKYFEGVADFGSGESVYFINSSGGSRELAPSTAPTLNVNTSTIAINSPVTFSVSATSYPSGYASYPRAYKIFYGDGYDSGWQTFSVGSSNPSLSGITHSYSTSGTYTATLKTIPQGYLGRSTTSRAITVNPPLTAPVISNIATNSNSVYGSYINFDISVTGSPNISYWQYSFDYGSNWTTVSSPSVMSSIYGQIYVTGGNYYTVSVRFVDTTGSISPASNYLSITAASQPGPLTNLVSHSYANGSATMYFTTGSNTASVQMYADYDGGVYYLQDSISGYVNTSSNSYGTITLTGASYSNRYYQYTLFPYFQSNIAGGAGPSQAGAYKYLNGSNNPTVSQNTPTLGTDPRTINFSWSGGGATNKYLLELMYYSGSSWYSFSSTTTTGTSIQYTSSDGIAYGTMYYLRVTPRYEYAGGIGYSGTTVYSNNITTGQNLTAPSIDNVQYDGASTWTISVSGGSGPYYQVWWSTVSGTPSGANYDAASTTTTITETLNTTGSVYWYARSSSQNLGNTTTAGTATAGTYSAWSSVYLAHQVIYDYNGGSGSTTRQTIKDSTYTTLPTPNSRSGYTFNGWYTAASGGSYVGSSGSSYYITSTQTLYAQWTQNNLTAPSMSSVSGSTGNLYAYFSGGSGPYYQIWWQATPTTPTATTYDAQGSSSPINVTNLTSPTDGQTYYFFVRSVSALNNTGSGPSVTVSSWSSNYATWTAPIPVPSGGSVTLTGGSTSGSVITASTSGWAGSPTSYDVYITTALSPNIPTSSSSRVASSNGSSSTSYTISPGDTASPVNVFRAFATASNSAGTSGTVQSSNTITATASVTVPSTPTNVGLTSSGSVSWTAVSGATSYEIQFYTARSSSGLNAAGPYTVTGISSSPYQLTSPYAAPNNYARVQVRARNSAGVSSYSAWVPSATTYT